MLPSLLLGSALLAFSFWMMYWNRQRFQRAQQKEETSERETDFVRRQYLRRRLVNRMLAVIGLAIAVGDLLVDPWLQIFYWSCIMMMVLGITVLAFADVLSTRAHYHRIYMQQVARRAELEAELKRLQSTEGNGRADHS